MEPWWPRDAVRNWKLLVDSDVGLDPDRVAQELAAWEETHEALTRDPDVLRLILQLADELPKWIGSESLRLLIAYDALVGRKCEAIYTVLAEQASEIRSRRRTCTDKQSKVLAAHGYDSQVDFDTAVKWIAEINELKRRSQRKPTPATRADAKP